MLQFTCKWDVSKAIGPSRVAHPVLLYLNHDIAFPSPTLAKAGDGAVHDVSTLWFDHAREQAGTSSLHRLEQLIAAIKDRAPEGREHEAVEQPGPRRFPGWLTRAVQSEVRRAESGESGAHAAPTRPSRRNRGNKHFAHPNQAGGGEARVESGREPLQVDRSGRRAGLDLHVADAAPHCAAQPVPDLRLSIGI